MTSTFKLVIFLVFITQQNFVAFSNAYPQNPITIQSQGYGDQLSSVDNYSDMTSRKFAVKPNASKKVALDEIEEDIETNQIPENAFSWANVMTTFMQMFFNNMGYNAPQKSDDIDTGVNGVNPAPWANILTMGLKIFNAVLGGYQQDNIDKVDNPNTPVQSILAGVLGAFLGGRNPDQVQTMAKQAGEFINICINLLDALKTSFSHRSLAARNIGKKDSVSDAAVASITLLKGYVKTYKNAEDTCLQKYMCEANRECVQETGGSSVFCQLGTYASSFLMGKIQGSSFDMLYEAGRQGRSMTDCHAVYQECNEV